MIKRANDNFLNAWKDFPGSNFIKYSFVMIGLLCWVEFFYPDFKDTTIFGDYTHFEKYSDGDKKGAMKLWSIFEHKHNFWKEHPEYFASATDQVHPNRKATKALAEFIHEQLR